MAPTRLIAWLGGVLFVAALLYATYAYAVLFGQPGAGDPVVASLVDVVLFSAFALHHSVLARTGAKAWVNRIVGAELERSAYVWVASALFIAVCALWRPVPGTLWSLSGWAGAIQTMVQIGGVVMTIAASRQLDALSLAGIRQAQRADQTPPVLKTDGFYRLVRHPIYFAWVLMVWPAAHMTGTRFVFAVVSTAYLAVAIPFEERSLVKLFGAEYGHYQRRVRWRMVPGLY